MRISEGGFDRLVDHTLRIELLDGKVLVYTVDIKNKQYLINKLRRNSDGNEENQPLKFIWFETCLKRSVIINTDSLVSITFCFDGGSIDKFHNYVDNFDVVYFEEEPTDDETESKEMPKDEELFLPQAIVYLKGNKPEDDYNKNPRTYGSLTRGCLPAFNLELEGECPFRQFINLTDDDGEETFIPLEKIIVMEFDTNLMDLESENEEDDEDDNGGIDYRLLN
jgi:hypothetical protein